MVNARFVKSTPIPIMKIWRKVAKKWIHAIKATSTTIWLPLVNVQSVPSTTFPKQKPMVAMTNNATATRYQMILESVWIVSKMNSHRMMVKLVYPTSVLVIFKLSRVMEPVTHAQLTVILILMIIREVVKSCKAVVMINMLCKVMVHVKPVYTRKSQMIRGLVSMSSAMKENS